MAPTHHPVGVEVDIVGTEESGNGQSCFYHKVCGSIVTVDTVVKFWKIQILNRKAELNLFKHHNNRSHQLFYDFSSGQQKEETVIAVHVVKDGIDQCCVGFMPWHFVAHADRFDGQLAQVIHILCDSENSANCQRRHQNRGCCVCAIISTNETTVA